MPDTEALVAANGSAMTWAEVDELAERLACCLWERGVRPGARVGILARNCLELVSVYAAANKIGAIYAPINYRLTAEEITGILRDCRPSALLLHEGFRDLVSEVDTACVTPWSFGPHGGPNSLRDQCTRAERGSRPAVSTSSSDPSWICYTGGTTGRPKGVVLTHDNMLATAARSGRSRGSGPTTPTSSRVRCSMSCSPPRSRTGCRARAP